MTCEEFGRVLPELEGVRSFELEQHVRSCPRCLGLVSDLDTISGQARVLDDALDGPSPRVWVSIEKALRQEGLIHDAQPQLVFTAPHVSRRKFVWLMPVLATLLIVFGLVVHQRRMENRDVQLAALHPSSAAKQASALVPEEEELLKLVAARSPGLRSTYESDLKAVDAYIHDAELSARMNPNDEIAQQYLMNAYEQKAMVYELAMDRSQQ
jgi:hypothetical protein